MLLAPGIRVVRGPDWSWQNQDGGEGHVGTVCDIGRAGSQHSPDLTVVVNWDAGMRTNYRTGHQGQFDLRVVDNAQIGVKHPNIICDGCKKAGLAGIRFRCAQCPDYDLCSSCYGNDFHDTEHSFVRYQCANSIGVPVSPRKGAVKLQLRGIFVGAKVVRGPDWEWGSQDGGEGKVGRVMDIRGWDNESCRSVANVSWVTGSTNVYRLGHKGNVDLKYVQEANGGFYYRDHMPVLGQPEPTQPACLPATLPHSHGDGTGGGVAHLRFSVGDRVKVCMDVETLRQMQQGHGGWNPRMAQYIGKVGIVHRVTDRGDIRVQHEGCNNRWTFHPAALVKVNALVVGDSVNVISDATRMQELQQGHGEWIEAMRGALGKPGQVMKVYSDGDLRIQVAGQTWTLNPQCVIPVTPQTVAERCNSMADLSHHRAEPAITPLPVMADSTGLDKLVREAAQGNIDVVKNYLEKHPDQVDARSGGKTCLQVASHQGHLNLVHMLLEMGANVNQIDQDGDSTLHYAAFGNQPEDRPGNACIEMDPDFVHVWTKIASLLTRLKSLLTGCESPLDRSAQKTFERDLHPVMRMLLVAGARLDVLNAGQCSALHISAHKKPPHCVKVLLEHGADVNTQDSYGDTALHDAIGKESTEVIQLLCNTPAMDITLRNKRGFNALHHAALKGNTLAAELLLQRARQLVDVKKDDGFSALHLACLNGHVAVAEILVRKGQADINLRNNRRQTALLLAVSQGHCSVIESLVKMKCDLNAQDEDGDTALHLCMIKRAAINSEVIPQDSPTICAIYQHKKLSNVTEHRLAYTIACFLVQEGCNMDLQNSKGKTVLDLIQNEDVKHLLQLLNSRRIESQPEVVHDLVLLPHREHTNITAPLPDIDNLSLNDIEKNSPRSGGSRGQNPGPSESARRQNVDSTSSPELHVSRKNSIRRTKDSGKNKSMDDDSKENESLECIVCNDMSSQIITFEPCSHRIACEDCASRMKKCLKCGIVVEKRITFEGKLVASKSRLPSADRMRYLETKIQEIEETHCCSICMERRRNVAFLCGHGACAKCAEPLKTCHMCRKNISKKINLY